MFAGDPGTARSELFGTRKGAFNEAIDEGFARFPEDRRAAAALVLSAHSLPTRIIAAGDAYEREFRVLDGGEETRVGAGKPFTSNVSLIAATNRDLLAEVQAKRFREDLFEKLRQIHLRMPPPRERTGDIPLLAAHFVAQLCAKHAALIQALRKPAVPSGIPRGGFRLPYNCGSSNSFFACRRRGSERSGNFVSSFEPVEFQLDRNRMTEAVR